MIIIKVDKEDEKDTKFDVEITGVIRQVSAKELVEILSKIVDVDKQTEIIGINLDHLDNLLNNMEIFT